MYSQQSESSTSATTAKPYYLAAGYVPIVTDVLCGRGKACTEHSGNKVFMDIIRSSLGEYTSAPSRIDKSIVVRAMVKDFLDSGIRFLKFDTKRQQYFELTPELAHSKVGHSIRDVLKNDSKKNMAARPDKASSFTSKNSIKKTVANKRKETSSFSCTNNIDLSQFHISRDIFSISSLSSENNAEAATKDEAFGGRCVPKSSDQQHSNNKPLPINWTTEFDVQDMEELSDILVRRRSSSSILSDIFTSSLGLPDSPTVTPIMESLLRTQKDIFATMICDNEYEL